MGPSAQTVFVSTASAALVSAAVVLVLSQSPETPPPDASLDQSRLMTRLAELESLAARTPRDRASLGRSASGALRTPYEATDSDATRVTGTVRSDPAELDGVLGRLDRIELQLEALRQDPIDRGFSFLTSRSARARREGIELLKRFAAFDPRAREQIRGMLVDEDASVRREAVDALGDIRDEGALDQIRSLTYDPDADVRREAIDSLRDILNRMPDDAPERAAAIAAMTRRVTDSDRRVREEMADALGDLRTTEANSSLAQLLGDESEGVREEALDALRRTADATVIPALQQFYATTDNPRQRVDAAVALARAGDRGPFQQEAAGLVGDLQNSNNARERARAAWILGQVDPAAYREALTQALQDPSGRVRRAAERALRRVDRG